MISCPSRYGRLFHSSLAEIDWRTGDEVNQTPLQIAEAAVSFKTANSTPAHPIHLSFTANAVDHGTLHIKLMSFRKQCTSRHEQPASKQHIGWDMVWLRMLFRKDRSINQTLVSGISE